MRFNSFFPHSRSRISIRILTGTALLAIAVMAGACSVSGPPFRDAPTGETALPAILEQGYYRFQPAISFFDGPQVGEVYFSSTRSRENSRGLFHLRILGRDLKGAVRVRQYEGETHRFGERIELRAQRCYLFGKREWDDRLAPLKRWECDHLVFTFSSASNFERVGVLHPVPDHERGEFSDWFRSEKLSPMPDRALESGGQAGAKPKQAPIFFAGQIFPIAPGEILPDDATVVVWGYRAGRVLRDGQILQVRGTRRSQQSDSANAAPRRARSYNQEFTGRLKIISRPGDFLLCKWMPGSGDGQALTGDAMGVAYTRDSLLNQGGGLFD
ncbi:MAG: hypothetical protein NXI24_21035 [bacterium]|nr:hypothetical protein [bacterium]